MRVAPSPRDLLLRRVCSSGKRVSERGFWNKDLGHPIPDGQAPRTQPRRDVPDAAGYAMVLLVTRAQKTTLNRMGGGGHGAVAVHECARTHAPTPEERLTRKIELEVQWLARCRSVRERCDIDIEVRARLNLCHRPQRAPHSLPRRLC